MKVDITYPIPGRERRLRQTLIQALKWPFLFAAYICPVINLAVGGKAWSLVVLWALFMVWSCAVSPALVEYNRVSQAIKLLSNACVLMILVDALLSPGWALEAVPIVCCSGLALSAILFFTDLERQKQNMMPLLLLAFASLIVGIFGLILWWERRPLSLIVLAAVALALLAGCAYLLGPDFVRELKKRFHTK